VSGGRVATDRWDWTLIAECPNNGTHVEGDTDPDDPEHLTIEASAENAAYQALDVLSVAGLTCGVCGAEIDYVVEEGPHEVLE